MSPAGDLLGPAGSAWLVHRVVAMALGRTENTINPTHLVTPRRIVVPMPKPFDAPAGVIPFHRMLESENLVHRSEIEPAQPAAIARRDDSFEPSRPIGLLPKLAELPAITKPALVATKVEQTHQVELPATGRLLDLYL